MAEHFKIGTHSLDPQTRMFIAAVVKRLVPASLNSWRHRTASVEKDADCWKWPKPKKTCKNLGKPKKTKKNLEKPKKKKQIRESWLGPPPPKSLEILFFFVFWFFQCFFFFFGFPMFWQVFPRFFWFLQVFSRFFWFSQVLASLCKVFPRFFPGVGYCKETGMNHRQSCQSAFGSAVKHQ